MAPITVSKVAPLLALLLGSTSAFAPNGRVAAPSSLPGRQQQQRQQCRRAGHISHSPAGRGRLDVLPVRMAIDGVDSTPEEKAARLRETAAAFRAQAAALEEERAQQRRAGAERSFNKFDSNNDGVVGIAELRAGLEGPLKKTFTAQLTTRMGRKPTPEEIELKIAELPGGSLFPDDLARRLIDMYDQNGDGLLQESEFAPAEELRARLESIFRERREEELDARKEERQRQMEAKLRAEGKGGAAPGETNDASATATEKALCALPYLLPLSDGVVYAQHMFGAFPDQLTWAQPFAGILLFYNNLPFATLVTFFGMSILASNPKVNKLLRFNMLQAINFDIALITPAVLGPLSEWSLGRDAYKLVPLTNVGSDVLVVALLAAVAYSISASAKGTFPNKLPFFGRINRENPDRES